MSDYNPRRMTPEAMVFVKKCLFVSGWLCYLVGFGCGIWIGWTTWGGKP